MYLLKRSAKIQSIAWPISPFKNRWFTGIRSRNATAKSRSCTVLGLTAGDSIPATSLRTSESLFANRQPHRVQNRFNFAPTDVALPRQEPVGFAARKSRAAIELGHAPAAQLQFLLDNFNQ